MFAGSFDCCIRSSINKSTQTKNKTEQFAPFRGKNLVREKERDGNEANKSVNQKNLGERIEANSTSNEFKFFLGSFERMKLGNQISSFRLADCSFTRTKWSQFNEDLFVECLPLAMVSAADCLPAFC